MSDHERAAILNFCAKEQWAVKEWKDQPHIKSLFDLAALLRSEPKTTFCTWSEDDDGNWSSSCGNAWSMEAGTPQENGYAYCPNCGAQIEYVEHVGVIDDEDEPKEESRE